MQIINLDANASVPALPSAKKALVAALDLAGNASSPHALGRQQRALLDHVRRAVAQAMGAGEKQVIFNSGASEGNRWLVDAVVKSGKLKHKAPKVVTTPLEHPSLMKPLKEAYLDGLIELSILQISPEGDLVFGPEDFAGADVIFATAAHNETGRIVNLSAIAALVQSHTILISDAAQACGRLGPLPERIDAMVVSAHKMGGVVGAGAMVIRGNARNLPAPWAGGGQESGLRPGTEALPLLAAFGAACRDIEEIRDAHQALASHRDSIEQKLLSAWPFARVIAGRGPRIPNTSAIMLEGVDGEALRIAIDTTLVCVGFGSACSALAPEPSPALLAMGLTSQQARATIRISLFPGTSRGEVDEALGRIVPAVLRFKT